MIVDSGEINKFSDGELMATIRESRDRDKILTMKAISILYERYHSKLLCLCNKVCGGMSEADLVFESTWKKVYKYPTFDPQKTNTKFFTWLSKIAKNEWYSLKEKCLLNYNGIIEDYQDSVIEEKVQEVTLPLTRNPLITALQHIKENLSEKDWDILLRHFEFNAINGKHLPKYILEELKIKYHTTSAAIRQAKGRALEKAKQIARLNV